MAQKKQPVIQVDNDPLWYKDAIIYELHVRSFFDSDNDGHGDFRGLAQKMDYLQDLGVTAIWLLPFFPSPLRDDGYDIAHYTSIHDRYGTLRDFRAVLREAQRRDIKVICELVINHTSDQHPWFQRARRSKKGSPHRDFYVWSDHADKYQDARIIFQDFEQSNWTWDPEAQAYYWHRFFSHQPDLNFENPRVRRAVIRVMDFWLEMGVSGLRLDAVPYLYEEEGTTCENLPATHDFLRDLRGHIERKFKGRMLLAEANQWPEDAAEYFGNNGDECHMNFHFPLMPRMFMSVQLEDRFPIVDILQQTPEIHESSQWALFLRNHDELTLEMVTDEERDYMYRAYAQDMQARVNLGIRRRLAPLLGNNRRRIELLNALLFSLPGTPVLYYGDEIGMGDNFYLGDRNGVRTPMQWSADRNAGFSYCNPQQLYLPIITDPEYRYEAINVETQQRNPHSLLWWMKRLIALRKDYKAFSRGTLELLDPENRKVLTFVRKWQDETILVVANLSRYVQYLELDLSEYQGMSPVEIFGQQRFPKIGELPYFITLGPHTFYWFALERAQEEAIRLTHDQRALQKLRTTGAWQQAFSKDNRKRFEKALGPYLRLTRWFGGKARHIKTISVADTVSLPFRKQPAEIVLVRVEYTEGDPETYVMPLTFAEGERADGLESQWRHAIVARLDYTDKNGQAHEGVLYDAFFEEGFCQDLLAAIRRRRRFSAAGGELYASTTRVFTQVLGETAMEDLEPQVVRGEQSNTSVIFGHRFILKVFRRIEAGINPDLEIGRFLTTKKFAHVASLAGALELRRGRGEPVTLGVLQEFVAGADDAWSFTLDAVGRYFDLAQTRADEAPKFEYDSGERLRAGNDPSETARDLIGHYLGIAQLLGQRSAQMHMTLASELEDPAFTPQSFTPHYQRSLYQSMRNVTGEVFDLLNKQIRNLPSKSRESARALSKHRDCVLNQFRGILGKRISGQRIRTHGDYHLGQVLYTGKDFVILDFEGEPARSLTERRLKRSPLRDVAGMQRSFHYAAYTVLFNRLKAGTIHEEHRDAMEQYARFWYLWVSMAFLAGYLETARTGSFLPRTDEEMQTLLDAYLLDKAVYELGYELNNRQEWVEVPVKGILDLLTIPDSSEEERPQKKSLNSEKGEKND